MLKALAAETELEEALRMLTTEAELEATAGIVAAALDTLSVAADRGTVAEAELKLRPALALTERPALEMGLRGSAEVGMDPVAEASSKLRPALTLTESPALRERPAKLEPGEGIGAGRGLVTESTDNDGIEMGFKTGAEGLEIGLDARPVAIGATVRRDGTGTLSVKVNGIKVVRLDRAGTEPDACPEASGAMTVSRDETETFSVTGNGVKVGRLDGTEAETEAETDACAEAGGLTMVSRVETEPVPVTGNGIMVARVDRPGPDNASAPELDNLVAVKADKSKLGVAADSSVDKGGEAAIEIDWLSSGFPDEVGKDRSGDINIDGTDGNAADEAGELIGARFIEADAEIDSAGLNNGWPDEIGKARPDDADIDGIGGNEADTADKADAAKPPGADIDGIGGNEVGEADAGELIGPRFIEADAETEIDWLSNGLPEIGRARADDADVNGIDGNEVGKPDAAKPPGADNDEIGKASPDDAEFIETSEAEGRIIWLGDGIPEIGRASADDDNIDGIGGNEVGKAGADKLIGVRLIDADADAAIKIDWLSNGFPDEIGKARPEEAEFIEASEAEGRIIWLDNGVPEIGRAGADDDNIDGIDGNEVGKSGAAKLIGVRFIEADAEIETIGPDDGTPEIGNARLDDGNIDGIGGNWIDGVPKAGAEDAIAVGIGKEVGKADAAETPGDRLIEADAAIEIIWLGDDVPEIGKGRAEDGNIEGIGGNELDKADGAALIGAELDDGNIDGIGGNWLDGVPKAGTDDANIGGIGKEVDKTDAAKIPGPRFREADAEIDTIWPGNVVPEINNGADGANIDGIDGNAVAKADVAELPGARLIEAEAETEIWPESGIPETGKAGADDFEPNKVSEAEVGMILLGVPEIGKGRADDGMDAIGKEGDKADAAKPPGATLIDADAEIEIWPDNGGPEIGKTRADDANVNEVSGAGVGIIWLDNGGADIGKAGADDPKLSEASEAEAGIIWPDNGVPGVGKTRVDDTKLNEAGDPRMDNVAVGRLGSDSVGFDKDTPDTGSNDRDADNFKSSEADTIWPDDAETLEASKAEVGIIWIDGAPKVGNATADDGKLNEASEAGVGIIRFDRVPEIGKARTDEASGTEVGIIWPDNGEPEIGNTRADDDKLNEAGDPRLENIATDNGVPDRTEPGKDGKIELGNAEEVKVGRPGPESVGFNEDTPNAIDPNGRDADSFTSSEADTTWPDDAKSLEAGKAEVGITWLSDEGVPEIGKASADDAKGNEAGDPRLDSVAADNAFPDRIEPGNDGKTKLGNGEDDKAGRPGPDSVGVDKDTPDTTSPDGKDADAFTPSDADKIWPDNAEPVKAGETGPDSVGVDKDTPDTTSPDGKDADAFTSTEADKICPDDAKPVKAGKFGPDSDGADEDTRGNTGPTDKDADAFTSTEADKIWPDDAELVEAVETGPETDSVETSFDGASPDKIEPSEADGVERDRGSPMETVPDTTALMLGADAESNCSDVGGSADGEAPDNKVVKPDRVPGSWRVEEPTPGNCRPDDARGNRLVVKPESRPDNVGLGAASPDDNFVPDDTAPPDVDEACNVDPLDDANPEVTELADDGPNEREADNSSCRPGVSASDGTDTEGAGWLAVVTIDDPDEAGSDELRRMLVMNPEDTEAGNDNQELRKDRDDDVGPEVAEADADALVPVAVGLMLAPD
ncbi:hypothetical protein E4U43_005105 [Claviceps pusilla]|uniref:Uncharacterized protein n=1 Tax=Claviceps pusilla TaxID=123648 RepID=A0A9P7NEU7_9HYPO|nr:hypothetical protein E4U43_005105 [Claviceps pusilla]